MRERPSRIVKALKVLFTLVVGLAALFVPAGTLCWPEAWILIAIYLSAVLALIGWMKKHDPGLLRERTQGKKEGRTWDKMLLLLYGLLLLLMFVVCGLDAVRFRIAAVPFPVKLVAFLGFVPVMILIFLVYKENTFASEVVRLQEDRKHRVITSGPYRIVRHPMYSGIILLMLLLPLALGSFLALIVGALIIILFFIRTALEDAMLQKELPGYAEYAGKVRWRLIPGVF